MARFGKLAGLFASAVAASAAATGARLNEAPLVPPRAAGGAGAPLFTTLPPAQTGLVTENRYADPRMWTDRYQELVYGAFGTGVAIGDYDNDGRPDIFVASKTEGGRLFRNLGDWKFEDVTAKAGLPRAATDGSEPWQQGVTFADVNNDGWLDIYVCRFAAPNLLFINQGDGTFKEEAAARGLAIADASGMGAFCDYDRDGWLDVYITTNMLDAGKHPDGQRGYLFHNNGDGTFTNVTDRAGITGESLSHSATWWDYDGDGWPDLYVANDYAAPDRLWHNNRDGTFTDMVNQAMPHLPYYAMGADLGDVNNDGLMDLFVADMAASSHVKDQRGMAYSRARGQTPPADPHAAPQVMHNALLVNTGTGHFLEAAQLAGLAATDWTWSVRLEDLDNDGRLDLFVTNGMSREYHNADLLDRTMTVENPAQTRQVVRNSPRLDETNFAFRNLGDLRFEEVGKRWGLDQRGVSFGAAFGDLDGDGDLDLVYANYEGGVTLLRNDGTTGHRVIVALRGTKSNRFGVGATVHVFSASGHQVRQLVLARGYLSSSEPVLHFGLGEDTVIDRLRVEWPGGAVQEFTQLGVDRRLTITEEPTAQARPLVEPPGLRFQKDEDPRLASTASTASEVDQKLLPWRFNNRGPALAIGADGAMLLGGTGGAPAKIVRQGKVVSLPATGPLDDGPALLFDANGDGHEDALVTKGGAGARQGSADYQPRLFLNDGQGGFTAGELPPLAFSVGAAAVADFDRDGKLDVFLGGRVLPGRYPLTPKSALLANRGGGRFEDVAETLGLKDLGMVTSALWSDVDDDGWPDLLLALDWGPVRCFHNEQGSGFTDWSERLGFAAAGSGWWTSLASADFNGDGRPDFVAGNVGLNSPYHADATHPALLYFGAFSGTGSAQLLEAYYEDEQLYPWRTRRDLGAQIPSILQRFPRNDVYARATLGEIVGDDKLKAARKFAATQLQSGVFLSQPDGTYRFSPLPRIAQVAPLQGIVAGDFDGDGHADIYAVQNSSSPIPSIGPFNGGLSQLLLGDGRGGFIPVEPRASQLIVTGDAKALVLADPAGNGQPGFVVTRNQDSPLRFHLDRLPAGNHSLLVRLQGKPGNPTALGARLTLRLADDSRQTAEIQAGGGYLSQSAPFAAFGYSGSNAPRELVVRWPDGTSSTHAVPAGQSPVTITQP